MSEDDLYTGPTLLAPGPKKPWVKGQVLSQAVFIPLILAFTFVILVFYVLFTTAQVDGPSMLPTLHNGDHVLITHGVKNPKRGDIVVVFVDENGTPIELVKRVVGLPGDTVEVKKDVAYVNGVAEPQRGQHVESRYSITQPAVKVPRGNLYLMGDNRPVSEDSRYIGTILASGLKGRVVAVFSPVTRMGLVH